MENFCTERCISYFCVGFSAKLAIPLQILKAILLYHNLFRNRSLIIVFNVIKISSRSQISYGHGNVVGMAVDCEVLYFSSAGSHFLHLQEARIPNG